MKGSHRSIIDTNFLSVYSLRNFISKYVINLFRSRSLARSLAQSPFLYLSVYRSVFLFLPIFFLGLFLFPFCSRCLFSSHYATARRRILSFTRSPFHSLSLFLCLSSCDVSHGARMYVCGYVWDVYTHHRYREARRQCTMVI